MAAVPTLTSLEDAGLALDTEARQLADVLERRALDVVFQPIMLLDENRVFAFEALSRFTDFTSPYEAFSAAARLGYGPQLELLAIERAFEHFDDLFPGLWMAVKLSHEALLDDAVVDVLLSHDNRNIAVELTEHTTIGSYPRIQRVLTRLRETGVQIVVEEMGAGLPGLEHMLRLEPDVIKLDIGITRGIDRDPARRAVAAATVAFADELEAGIIAEGIETADEMATLLGLGIKLGQGYYVAKPSALP